MCNWRKLAQTKSFKNGKEFNKMSEEWNNEMEQTSPLLQGKNVNRYVILIEG